MTWHPDPDVAVGWTPDSKRVLFRSSREAYADIDRLYTVPVEGGWPDVLPMWRGEDGSFSPDGSRIAFAWNGDPLPGTKGFDLYVKAIGSETLLRLTHPPSEWISQPLVTATWMPNPNTAPT